MNNFKIYKWYSAIKRLRTVVLKCRRIHKKVARNIPNETYTFCKECCIFCWYVFDELYCVCTKLIKLACYENCIFFFNTRNACWCGNQYPSSRVKVNDSKCDLHCVGDPTKFCGGSWKLSVYATGIVGEDAL